MSLEVYATTDRKYAIESFNSTSCSGVPDDLMHFKPAPGVADCFEFTNADGSTQTPSMSFTLTCSGESVTWVEYDSADCTGSAWASATHSHTFYTSGTSCESYTMEDSNGFQSTMNESFSGLDSDDIPSSCATESGLAEGVAPHAVTAATVAFLTLFAA